MAIAAATVLVAAPCLRSQPRPAPTRAAWTVQGVAAHVEGNDFLRSPRGVAVRVQRPLGASPFFAGIGAAHLTDVNASVGYPCIASFFLPRECGFEPLTQRGRMTMGELFLGARVSGAGAVEAEVHAALSIGNLTGRTRGDSSGLASGASKAGAGARLGADVTWWRWQGSRVGVRLGASAGGVGSVLPAADDGYDPFASMYEHYELRLGVTVRSASR